MTYKVVINGELVSTKETFDVLNPATESATGKAPHCTEVECDAAVKAAQKAFPGWRDTDIAKRKQCLESAMDVLKKNSDVIATLLCQEQGKPKGGENEQRAFVGASGEMAFCNSIVNRALSLSPSDDVTLDSENHKCTVYRKPIGAVAGILPWNYPVAMFFMKFAPAVVLGNTFVAKPSPFTPLATLKTCELIRDCFPPGVLNIVTSADAKFSCGAFLTSHPGIRKVSFTGSLPTGKAIMKSCADDVKRLTLELGGNDAAIVRKDCEVKKVAAGVFKGAFANTGQVCVAIKRCYVHSSIHDEFVKEISSLASTAKVGDGMDLTTDYGPLNNKMQYDKVLSFIEDAKKDGGVIEAGGRAMDRKGYFIEPTIVSGLKEGARLVDDEQFGPVLPIIKFEDDDDAITRANSTVFGLGGSVWSADVAKANEMASRLQSGTVWVNEHLGNTNGAPFGGFKQSGLGRECGTADLAVWTETQSAKLAKNIFDLPSVTDGETPRAVEPLEEREYKMLIGGELISGKDTFAVVNPATGEPFANAPHCNEEDCNRAISAAEQAFPKWEATPIGERQKCLQEALDILIKHKAELALLLCKEQGKPVGGETKSREVVGAHGEWAFTFPIIKKSIDMTETTDSTLDDETSTVTIKRKPVGVAVGILPWNFPVAMFFQKFSPAVVLGNTFVAKPSPFTPLTTLRICELIKDCFPPGVLNVVSSDDTKFRSGAFLTSHPSVRKVSFTGSVPTGKAIMKVCAEDIKRVTLEMGGNDAAIIRKDCDVKKIASGVFKGAFRNTGQVCIAVKRVYCHADIYEPFVREIAECAKNAKVGDGMDPTTDYGPLNNKMQYDKVLSFIEDAKKDGGVIEAGGRAMDRKGYFIEPTIVSGLKEGARLVDDEQFGPVLPIIKFEDDDDAVFRANNTTFGLGGSVWSADVAKANEMAEKLEAGSVWVNEHGGLVAGAPFGGFKHSGLGRERGSADKETWTEIQTLKTAKSATVA